VIAHADLDAAALGTQVDLDRFAAGEYLIALPIKFSKT